MAETGVLLIVFNCVLNHVYAYTDTFSYHLLICSTWIRYQKSYILVSDNI